MSEVVNSNLRGAYLGLVCGTILGYLLDDLHDCRPWPISISASESREMNVLFPAPVTPIIAMIMSFFLQHGTLSLELPPFIFGNLRESNIFTAMLDLFCLVIPIAKRIRLARAGWGSSRCILLGNRVVSAP
jgi:hypothetical protein